MIFECDLYAEMIHRVIYLPPAHKKAEVFQFILSRISTKHVSICSNMNLQQGSILVVGFNNI